MKYFLEAFVMAFTVISLMFSAIGFVGYFIKEILIEVFKD